MTISKLNKMQLGRYAETLMKMEFMRYGMEVYSPEIDDRGIDFLVGLNNRYYEIQVKSSRNSNYIFFRKDKFKPRENLMAAIVLFDGEIPNFYLIPSTRWNDPDCFFVSRDYEGKKTDPEFGLTLSKHKLPLLESYSFDKAYINVFE